jgi:hypothetical protein
MRYRPKIVQPHLVERPCRRCRIPTKALRAGQLLMHPTCERCRREEERQHALARLAADRQLRNRARPR